MGELVTSDDKNATSAREKSPRTPRRRRTPNDESLPSRLPAGLPSLSPSTKVPPTIPAKRRKTFHFRLPGRSSTRLSQVRSKIQDVGPPKTPNSHNPVGGRGTPTSFREVAVPLHAQHGRPGRIANLCRWGESRRISSGKKWFGPECPNDHQNSHPSEPGRSERYSEGLTRSRSAFARSARSTWTYIANLCRGHLALRCVLFGIQS